MSEVLPEELTAAERAVWDAFPRGEHVDLSTGDTETDDPAIGASWGRKRTVRAEVLTALLLGARPVEPGYMPAMRLTGARVTGALDLTYAEVPWPLRLRACHLTHVINLYGARTRQINLERSRLPRLYAGAALIDGNLRMIGCRVDGAVRLTGAHVTGALLLQGAALAHPEGIALLANRLVVDDDLLCRDGFTAEGEVRLAGARVGGMLDLNSAALHNPGGSALTAYNVTVGAYLRARSGFTAIGTVILNGSNVGNEMELSDAALCRPDGTALTARDMRVGGPVVIDHVTVDGLVTLAGTRVDGPLRLCDAELADLGCEHVRARELDLRGTRIGGTADLRYGSFGVLRDDVTSRSTDLRLDELTYDSLDPRLPATERLAWLNRDVDGQPPRIFEQLAASYRRLGDDAQARTVLLAKQRHRRRALAWHARVWSWLQEITVGYGYRPLRAAAWLVVLLLAGTVTFGTHHPRPLPGGPVPAFNPLIYSLDLLLPLVDFGQEQAYDPHGASRWLAYTLVAAGWVLATTIAAAVTRALRRD